MKMGGQWAAGTTWIDFEDVKVPVGNLLGEEGEGFRIIMTNFNHVRLFPIREFCTVIMLISISI